MKIPYKTVVIVYNPNSTGDGLKNAKKLAEEIKERSDLNVHLEETSHPGHATKIAKEWIQKKTPVLLISSSGDGGYNELVSGVLELGSPNHVYVAVMPSGNANDHANSMQSRALIDSIISPRSTEMDALSIVITPKNGTKTTKYAHSYAGIGLTAYIGKKLTKADLNPFNEKWLVIKYLLSFRRVKVSVDGGRRRYSSLVFGNIDRMSKVITLGNSTSVTDGKMEVYSIRYRSLARIMFWLLVGSTLGLKEDKKCKVFEFKTLNEIDMQVDGESFKIKADSKVRVSCNPKALKTIL